MTVMTAFSRVDAFKLNRAYSSSDVSGAAASASVSMLDLAVCQHLEHESDLVQIFQLTQTLRTFARPLANKLP